MEKILITGGSGFIGQYVIRDLVNRNIHCLALSCHKHFENSEKVEWLQYDFGKNLTEHEMDKLKTCSKVIHLAWSGLPRYNEIDQITYNLMPQFYFLQQILNLGIRDITITGTCLEYGKAEGAIDVNRFANPVIPYAIAKDSLRRMICFMQGMFPFNFKWIRLFYMFGNGQSPQSLYGQLSQAIDDGRKEFNMSVGDQIRDFMPVEDVAKYIVNVALYETKSGIYNCASNNPISVLEFVQNILKTRNSNIKLNLGYYPYPEYEPHAFWGIPTSININ